MKDPFSDELVEQAVKLDLSEAQIQAKCVRWIKGLGFWARKFASPANRSVPDYLFARVDIPKFAVEFKKPGNTSTDAQLEEQRKMREAGWIVEEINSVASFQSFVHGLIRRYARQN